jgi:uncharacterized protein (UPF0276 family)
MSKIYTSVACNLDPNILLACLPLFEQEKIEAIEWSFDALFRMEQIPPWFADLVSEFGRNNRLIGHGIYFSLFSGKWLPEQQQWLDRLRSFSQEFHFDHISEHFGFMTGADFHKGAPISIPFTSSTIALGTDRLMRIQDACNCAVGLENLAFAYTLDEVKRQGEFLNILTEKVNGFIILDLHNLYCQIHNFNVPFEELLQSYPLERVREIHISGGSWEQNIAAPEDRIRRDTHDDAVPETVFQLLALAISQCPNLKYVVLEQLGTALASEQSRIQFQHDFLKMDEIVKKKRPIHESLLSNHFLPESLPGVNQLPYQDLQLHQQQTQLSQILETASDVVHAQRMLASSSLKNTAWKIETWQPHMLETAMAIAQKWKEGFGSR